MGTPVIAFDEGGLRDSLDGCPAGVLIKNGAREMAVEVIRLLKDRTALKQMSEAGPRWTADLFSRTRMIDDYYRFFGALVDRQN
jgi:glycosyltransferase involved in cell wall biosynthesis